MTVNARRLHPAFARLLALALTPSLAILSDPFPAHAHGGEHVLQLDGAPTVGGRRLSLWTGPAVLRPGQILLEGLVTDPAAADLAVKGLSLRYEVLYQGGHHDGPPITVSAQAVETLSERNLKEELHLGVVDLQEAGPYQVTIIAAEPGGAQQASEVTLQVVPENPWLKRTLFLLSGVTGLITVAFVLHTFARLRAWWAGAKRAWR